MELLVIIYRYFPEYKGVYELEDEVHPKGIMLDQKYQTFIWLSFFGT